MKLKLVLLATVFSLYGIAEHAFPKIELQQTHHGFKAGQHPVLAKPGSSHEELEKAARALVEKDYLPNGCKAVFDYDSRGVLSYKYQCNGIAFPRSHSVMVNFDQSTNEVRLVRSRAVPKSFDDKTPTVDEKDAAKVAREAFEKELRLTAARVEKPMLRYLTDEKGVGRLTWTILISSSDKRTTLKTRTYLFYVTALEKEPKILHTEDSSPVN
jgi:hypothetical protein